MLHWVKRIELSARFLITSRANLDLEETGFDDLTRVHISAHRSDVEHVVKSRLSTNSRMRAFRAKDAALKQDIISKLVEKADGM